MKSVVPLPRAVPTRGPADGGPVFGPSERQVADSTFKAVWLAIVGAHLVLGLLRLFVTAFHSIMAIPAFYAALTVVRIPRGVLIATGACMGAVALAHFVSAVTTLRRSKRARQLTFIARSDCHRKSTSSRWQTCIPSLPRPVWFVWNTVKTAMDGALGIVGVFGVNGRWFFALFDGLRVLEILSQTYQAYQLSRFVQSTALNSVMVTLIAVNCWLTPLLLFLTRKNHESTRRLVVFSADLVLDVVYAEALPLLVLLPILAEYNWQIQAFPPERGLDDIWATNSVSQARFVLVTSYMDLVTTLVPNVNFLIGVQTIKSLLQGHRPFPSPSVSSSPPPTVKTKPQPHKRLVLWSSLFHVAVFLWGVLIIGLHIDARRNLQFIPSCKLPLAPWRIFDASKTPCAVMYINMYMTSNWRR